MVDSPPLYNGYSKEILAFVIILVVLTLITGLLPVSICVKAVIVGAIVYQFPMTLLFGIVFVFTESRRARSWKDKILDLAMLATTIAMFVLIDILFITNGCWAEPR